MSFEASLQKRLFVAVDLSDQVKDEVARIQAYFNPRVSFRGSLTIPENAHITLSFLGNVSIDAIENVTQALKTIQLPAMNAQLKNLGVFSKRNQIGVLYLNVACPNLDILAQEVNTLLSPWCAIQAQPFVAHITIARISSIKDPLQFLKVMKSFITKEIQFPIDRFSLKKSEHLIDRSVYTDIATYPLT